MSAAREHLQDERWDEQSYKQQRDKQQRDKQLRHANGTQCQAAHPGGLGEELPAQLPHELARLLRVARALQNAYNDEIDAENEIDVSSRSTTGIGSQHNDSKPSKQRRTRWG